VEILDVVVSELTRAVDRLAERRATNEQAGGFATTTPLVTGSPQVVTLLSMPLGRRRADTFTVQLGVVPPGPIDTTSAPPTFASCNCVVTATWVENGQQVQRVLSVGPQVSASISGSGSGLQLQAQDVAMGVHYKRGLPYAVTAILSPGLRGGLSVLPGLVTPASMRQQLTADSTAGPIPVPPGTRAALVTAVRLGAGGPNAELYAQAVSSGGDILLEWNCSLDNRPVPLPAATQFLNVVSLDATNVSSFTVTFLSDG